MPDDPRVPDERPTTSPEEFPHDPNDQAPPATTAEPTPGVDDPATDEGKGAFIRFLNGVEWLGNKLPDPVTLFALFAVAVILVSGLAGWLDLAVDDPRPVGASGRADDGMIRAVSLMNADGFRRILENLVTNFTGFAPLGTVLVALLGVGVAERSGLLGTSVRLLVLKAPKNLTTMAVVFAGVLSNTASEMGYVVLVPLAAVIFKAIGRHPLVGLAAAFAGVSGGYSANLLLGTIDPLLSDLTMEAALIIDPGYTDVNPACNIYFMMASTVLITLVGTWVTERFVAPQLGKWDPAYAEEDLREPTTLEQLTPAQKKGLWAALASIVVLTLGLILLSAPEGALLRNPDTGSLIERSPLLRSVVAFIFVFFLVPGVVYGLVVGTIRSDKDVVDGMAKSMSTLGLYIVLVFFAAQFVAFFKWTELGAILAVVGATFLQDLGLDGPFLLVAFILVSALTNLLMGSASAKWAVTAPIFVPMFMLLGYSPEVVQLAYRIGDSTTNIITPMMSYFGLILAFVARYDRRAGVGTVVAMMLPYTLIFLLTWSIFFYLWVFLFGFPIGPGAPIEYIPATTP
jgi:aminobenzoyl-glutamate transport protein